MPKRFVRSQSHSCDHITASRADLWELNLEREMIYTAWNDLKFKETHSNLRELKLHKDTLNCFAWDEL